MKMELSQHAGEISEHSDFGWMARCLKDCVPDVVVHGDRTFTRDIAPDLRSVLIIVLERLALIEGTNGAQWDDFLPGSGLASDERRLNEATRKIAWGEPAAVRHGRSDAEIHAALDWLEDDCHREAAAMERIDLLRQALVRSTPAADVRIYNVTVEARAQEFADRLRTGAVTDVVCTAGLGPDVRFVDVDFDVTRALVLFRFFDPRYAAKVAGTDVSVHFGSDRERIVVPIFRDGATLESADDPAINEAARAQIFGCLDEISAALGRYGDDVPGIGRIRERLAKMRVVR